MSEEQRAPRTVAFREEHARSPCRRRRQVVEAIHAEDRIGPKAGEWIFDGIRPPLDIVDSLRAHILRAKCGIFSALVSLPVLVT